MKPIVDAEVVCFERVREAYIAGLGTRNVVGVGLVVVLLTAGKWVSHGWLAVLGIVCVLLFILLPHFIRMNRVLRALPCPDCGKAVGSYRSAFSRVFLHCKHCGHVAPTDCCFLYHGGPPSKATTPLVSDEEAV